MSIDASIKPINNSFLGKDIVSLNQFDTESIDSVFQTTSSIISELNKGKVFDVLKGTISTLLFYEPSSRTFGSFAAAVKRMGGNTVDILNPKEFSSVSKGETFEDTIRVFEAYSDLIVLRHPEVGAAKRAAEAAFLVPVLNAGDGIGEHPTQALLDMFTIYEKFGKLSGLKVLIAGDLLYGRTVHSLLKGLAMYPDNTIYLLSPKQLRLSADYKEEFITSGLKLVEIESEEEIPQDCNVWYWTRVQKERFADLKEYEQLKTRFTITKNLLNTRGSRDMIILHPLPRVGEIEVAVDTDPRAYYLPKQVKNGMYVRMALVGKVLGKI